MKEQLPLAPEDIKRLRKHLIPMMIFPFMVVAMFGLFVSFIFEDFVDSFAGDTFGKIMIVVFGALFFGVIGYMLWSATVDLKRGFKYRITGKVTDKRLNVHTSTTTGSGGSRGSTGTSTKTTKSYFLYIDGEECSVEYKDYSRTKVDSYVVLDRAPRSKLTLKLTEVEPADFDRKAAEEQETENKKFLESRIQEVRLSDRDLEAIKSIYTAEKNKRFQFMAPVLIFDLLLIANGIWTFVVVIFPLLLVPLYQFYKIIRSYMRYNNGKLYGYKIGHTALVEDKLTFTSNRSGNVNRLVTTKGTINVNTILYDKLSVDDKIILFAPKQGKHHLSLITLDKEEFYLR
ncbi:hypothetical protein [Roseivirga sp.]|uniref:hypothetical protein n=1 Tax=Roseivirga sp. TaxID=1964215 RepID=UPI002B26B2F0|nr:hypothetical protein [Roseivirga sp.]